MTKQSNPKNLYGTGLPYVWIKPKEPLATGEFMEPKKVTNARECVLLSTPIAASYDILPLPRTPARTTYLVHGFHDRDGGEATVDTLIPYLEAASPNELDSIIQIDYGWFGIWSVMFQNKDVAKDLLAQQKALVTRQWHEAWANKQKVPRDYSEQYAIGHSNGCAIILDAARRGAIFKRVLLINPALPIDTIFPETIGEVIVVHTKHDAPTKAARWANRIPVLGWFVPDAWGAMGNRGAKYNARALPDSQYYDSRVFNIRMDWLEGHSSLFTKRNLNYCTASLLNFLYVGETL